MSCTATGSYTTQIDWFGTVRARIGYLWGDGAVLTYVTGGLACGGGLITMPCIVAAMPSEPSRHRCKDEQHHAKS